VAEVVLDKLRELQEADLQRRRLLRQKAAYDRTAKVRANQICRQQESIQALRDKQREARKAADAKELDVRQKRAEIEKLRAQQMQIKDNRQFQILQNEIKFAELAISKFEDEILADLGEIETLDADLRKAQEDLRRQEQELEALRKEIEAKKRGLDADIEACRRRQDAIAQAMPPKVVAIFNRIADRLDGEALAAVIRDEEDAEGGTFICGGCHMSVTQNTYVLLAGRSEDLCTCPNCTRILYLENA